MIALAFYVLWLTAGTVWAFRTAMLPIRFTLPFARDCRAYMAYIRGLVVVTWLTTAAWCAWAKRAAMLGARARRLDAVSAGLTDAERLAILSRSGGLTRRKGSTFARKRPVLNV
jgi:hypothetical protein